MARRVKSLIPEAGYAHREHRSKKGRKPRDKEWSTRKEIRFKKESLKFGEDKYIKKRKVLKFKL